MSAQITAMIEDSRTTYRGWHIQFDPPPIPTRTCDWAFWHDDYDGAEDSGDNRGGWAESLEAAKAEIDWRIAEEEIEAEARAEEARNNGQFGVGA